MNLSDLLKDDRIKKINPDLKQAAECLEAAERDLKVAEATLKEDFDWAFSIAYNAMLQSARALMFAEGFAPTGENHHKTTVDYADAKLGTKMRNEIDLFDDMRKKRHAAVYGKTGVISEFEAKHAISTAKEFVGKIRERIRAHTNRL